MATKEEIKNLPQVLKGLLKMRSIKRVDMMFDLIIFHAYLCGDMKRKLPVSESRIIFEHIKKLIKDNI